MACTDFLCSESFEGSCFGESDSEFRSLLIFTTDYINNGIPYTDSPGHSESGFACKLASTKWSLKAGG